jgi:D-aminopeptidase
MSELDTAVLEKRIDALFTAQHGRAVPGYAVGVLHQGQAVLSKGYGLASLEHGVPIRGDTVFRIASVSKQFTVSAVLMLAAEGRLGLHDDIRKHLPELPEWPAVVTVDHLMRNCSGLPDFLEMLRLGGVGLDLNLSRARMLALICRNRHLNFAPGSRFLYCNTNFLLLGVLVERLSGQRLAAFLHERIFRPLDMSQTAMTLETDSVVPGLASGYLQGPDGAFRRALHGFEQGGEGGMVSSVDDLMVWSRHFEQPLLAPLDLPGQLAEPTRLSGGHASVYARGVESGTMGALATLGHGGLWPGFKTDFLRIPEHELTVVVIANGGHLEPYRVAREVAAAVLGSTTPAMPPASTLEPLAGEWFSAPGAGQPEPALLELTLKGGRLIASQWGLPFQLVPAGDGSWVPLRGAYEFRMKVVAVDALEVEIGAGRTQRFARLPQRPAVPAGLAGNYACADSGALWTLEPQGAELRVRISGPVLVDGGTHPLRGVQGEVLELLSETYWLKSSQLLRLQRDAQGTVTHLLVDTGRVKGLRFDRIEA